MRRLPTLHHIDFSRIACGHMDCYGTKPTLPYNRPHMGPIHLLIPHALVAADFAPDLLRGLRLPQLDFLAAHAVETSAHGLAPLKPDLAPWQSWLLYDEPDANLAAVWARGIQWPLRPGSAVWMVEPVHYQLARDHLVLADPVDLDITEDEARGLAEAARPLLSEGGWTLENVTPQRWLLSRDEPGAPPGAATIDLSGAALECAIGLNIEPWLPVDHGSGAALQWRRVSNEIQMTWHDHPVNAQREARRQLAVNALWLSGNGASAVGRATTRLRDYRRIHTTLPLLRGYADSAAGCESEGDDGPVLKTWEAFIPCARAQNWSEWRNAIQALDAGLEGVVAELRSGRVPSLSLILCGDQTLRVSEVRRSDFWKFWRRGSAVELFADET